MPNLSRAKAQTEPQKPKEALNRLDRAAQTRQRILETAIVLFSQNGFEGVSVDEIVTQARINKRMVYHYFGNKSGLYAAALECVYDRLANVEAEVFSDEPAPDVVVERIVYAYFGFLQRNPEFVALLLWENLQGGRHLQSLPPSVTKAPILDALGRAIERGIESGQIRADLDKQHMLINLIGICLVYFSNRHTLSRTVGLDLGDAATMEEGIRHAISLVKHGFLRTATSR